MDIFNLKKNKLLQLDSKSFKNEKEIQKIVEDNLEELFNLKFVRSEYIIGKYRFDSLCFDQENNSFVIIEYKNRQSGSIIDQGYSYLGTMLEKKSDIILEYNENNKQNLKRGEVDWTQSKIIFISPVFSRYQKDSINFKDLPFELWECKKFSNNIIGFSQHTNSSNESIKSVSGPKNSIISDVSEELKVYTEDDHLDKVEGDIKNLYHSFKERVIESLNVEFKPKQKHIGLWKEKKMFSYLVMRKKHIIVNILSGFTKKRKTSLFKLKDPEKKFNLWSNEHKKLYQFNLKNNEDIEYVILMTKQKYDWVS